MKKLVALSLCIAMLLSLAACAKPAASSGLADEAKPGKPAEPAEAPAAEQEAFVIGILVPYASNDWTYHVNNGVYMQAEGKNIEFILVDAGDNQATQNDQCQTLINKGVDAIYCSPVDSDASPTILNICKESGIPVAFESRLPAAELWDKMIAEYEHCYYFGPDIKAPGVIQAEMLLDDWAAHPEWDKNGDGVIQYMFMHGDIGHQNSEGRREGFLTTMEKSGTKIEELDCQVGKFNAVNAKEITETWMAKHGDKIEAIVSVTDAMALGIIEALKTSGYNDGGGKYIPLYGVNGLQEACDAITAKEMQATVYTPMVGEGKIMLQVLYNVLTGKAPADGQDAVMDDRNCFYTAPSRVETPDEVKFVLSEYDEETAYIQKSGK